MPHSALTLKDWTGAWETATPWAGRKLNNVMGNHKGASLGARACVFFLRPAAGGGPANVEGPRLIASYPGGPNRETGTRPDDHVDSGAKNRQAGDTGYTSK